MASLFGLRQLSPKDFTRLQEQQRNLPNRKKSSGQADETIVTTDPTLTTTRQPLSVLSSNPPSRKNSSLITFRKIGRLSSKRTSSPVYSFDNDDQHQQQEQEQEHNNQQHGGMISRVQMTRAFRRRQTSSTSTSSMHSLQLQQQQQHQTTPQNSPTVDEIDENQVPALRQQIEELQTCCEEMATTTPRRQTAAVKEWWTVLRQKLVSIQAGLQAIDQERAILSTKAETLTAARNSLQQALDLRERELQTLSKRCYQQSEKLKNVHQMQAAHNSLNRQLTEVQSEVERYRKNETDFSAQVETIRTQKQMLEMQLKRVQTDYEAVTQQLETSLKQLERLTEEKQTWQEERTRLEQQFGFSKQQHGVAISELRDEISARDTTINALREEIHIYESKQRVFETEIHQMTVRHETELVRRQSTERDRLNEMQQQHASALEGLKADHVDRVNEQMTVAEIQDQLIKTKTAHTEELNRLCSQHAAVVTAHEAEQKRLLQELLQEREAGHELLKEQAEQHEQDEEALVADFERLLEEQVEKVKTEYVSKMQVLQASLEEHETNLESLQEQVKILQRDGSANTNENADHLAKQTEYEARIAELEAIIESQRQRTESTISGKNDTHTDVIEDLNREHERQTEELQKLHRVALERLQKDAIEAIRTVQQTLQDKHGEVLELQSAVEDWERRYRGQSDVYSRSVTEGKLMREQLNAKIQALQSQVQSLMQNAEESIPYTEIQLENEKLRGTIADMQSKFTQSEKEMASSTSYIAQLETTLTEKESEISSFVSSISALKEKCIRLESMHEERNVTVLTLERELESTMKELMVVSSELESAKEDTTLVRSLTSDLEALQAEYTNAEELLHEKDVNIAELEAEILKLEIENEIERQQNSKVEMSTATRKAAHNREVQSLRNYISELRRDLDQASRQLVDYRRLHAKSQSMVNNLEDELRNVQASAVQTSSCSEKLLARQSNESQRAREDYEMNKKILQDRLSALEHDLSRSAKAHSFQLKTKENTIEKLTQKLEEAEETISQIKSKDHEELAVLRQQLHECRLEVDQKDDELNDLKCRIIPKCETQLQTFMSRLKSYQQEIQTLQADKRQTASERDELEKVFNEKSAKSQACLDEFVRTIEDQKCQLHDQSYRLAAQQDEIKNLRNDLSSSLRRCEDSASSRDRLEELESTNDNLLREVREQSLELSEEKSRSNDLESTIRQLRLELENQERRNVTLKSANEENNREIDRLIEELNKKTKQCVDTSSKYKICTAELESCKHCLRESVSLSEELELKLSHRRAECSRLSTLLQEKEAEQLAQLEHEHALRELADEELQELRSKLEILNAEKQSNADLLKENKDLKDKIQRQEAYLQRRLKKERLSRQRAVHNNTQEVFRLERPPQALKIKSSNSFCSQASGSRPFVPEVSLIDFDDSSFDEELDNLLAD